MTMSKGMKWFTEEFLPSIEKRMTNPKYPNQAILSVKQADVCYRYMTSKQHSDCSYGKRFTTYEVTANGKKYMMTERGKYTFLNVYQDQRGA